MAKYIAKRVALAIVTLLVLTSVVFVLVRLMPGDPFSSDKMTPEIKANLEAYYGLDKPLAEQYITYMKNVLHGDLGYSMKVRQLTVLLLTHSHTQQTWESVHCALHCSSD